MIAIDFNKRHNGKEVKSLNTISQILKNSIRILEVGDNLKYMKQEKALSVSRAGERSINLVQIGPHLYLNLNLILMLLSLMTRSMLLSLMLLGVNL